MRGRGFQSKLSDADLAEVCEAHAEKREALRRWKALADRHQLSVGYLSQLATGRKLTFLRSTIDQPNEE